MKKVKVKLYYNSIINTVMLSFDVLIGLHKVPELFLALFCQELTEGEGEKVGGGQCAILDFVFSGR